MRSAALLALAVCAPAEAKAKASKDLPSFLFMLGDDIGWADMGYAGGESCGSRSAVCCRGVACRFLCCFFALAAALTLRGLRQAPRTRRTSMRGPRPRARS